MHRVFVAATDDARPDYWLHAARSAADLAAMGDDLVEGATVRLVSPGRFEITATLRFQHEVNCWIAYPVRSGA